MWWTVGVDNILRAILPGSVLCLPQLERAVGENVHVTDLIDVPTDGHLGTTVKNAADEFMLVTIPFW